MRTTQVGLILPTPAPLEGGVGVRDLVATAVVLAQ